MRTIFSGDEHGCGWLLATDDEHALRRADPLAEDLKIDGDKLSFSAKVPTPMGEFPVSFEAEVSGDSLAGNYETMMGSTPFTGAREA